MDATTVKCPACGRILRPRVVSGKRVHRQLECPGMSCGALWWEGKRGRVSKPVFSRPAED